jgi:hypothetical protein
MSKTLSNYPFLINLERITTPIRGNVPGLNLIGYIIPLLISLTIIALSIRNLSPRDLYSRFMYYKWWLLAATLAIVISFLIPNLSESGRTDYPLTIVVAGFAAIYLRRGGLADKAISCFALGYLVGFVSDLQSQVFFTGFFGGGGFLDGDFILPVFLCLAALISRPLVDVLEDSIIRSSITTTMQSVQGGDATKNVNTPL